MKFMKLLSSVAAVFCLLAGATGTAMADNFCPGGYISGVIDDDVTVLSDASCVIQDASVSGDILASGANDVVVISTQVGGNIVLDNSSSVSVIISAARNIRLRRNAFAAVMASLANRNIVVRGNAVARVKQSGAVVSIICQNNGDLDESRNNTEGEEECND